MQIIRKYKRFYLLNGFIIYIIPFLFLIISGSYVDFLTVSALFLVPLGCFLLGIIYGVLCKTANDLPVYALTVSFLVFPAVFVPNLTGRSFGDRLQALIIMYSSYFVLTIFAGLVGLLLRAFLRRIRSGK